MRKRPADTAADTQGMCDLVTEKLGRHFVQASHEPRHQFRETMAL